MTGRPVVGLLSSAAGSVVDVRAGLVEPLLADGLRVAVTLTPTAAAWLEDLGEVERLRDATGLPVRWSPRLPREPRPHPDPDVWLVAPATANTVAKLALGIADGQGLTSVGDAIAGGSVPVLVVPHVDAGRAGHPAWAGHLATLASAGVRVLGAPGAAPAWEAVRRAAHRALRRDA